MLLVLLDGLPKQPALIRNRRCLNRKSWPAGACAPCEAHLSPGEHHTRQHTEWRVQNLARMLLLAQSLLQTKRLQMPLRLPALQRMW
jgi:hypothetical protein